MKTIHFLIVLMLLLGKSLLGQENEVSNKICSGKWYMEYLIFDGDKELLPLDEQMNNWVIFHPDGKHEVMEEGEKYYGEWELLISEMILRTNDRDGKVDQKIVEITDSILVVSVEEQYAKVVMGLKKLK